MLDASKVYVFSSFKFLDKCRFFNLLAIVIDMGHTHTHTHETGKLGLFLGAQNLLNQLEFSANSPENLMS